MSEISPRNFKVIQTIIVKNMRENVGIYKCNKILNKDFENHENDTFSNDMKINIKFYQ